MIYKKDIMKTTKWSRRIGHLQGVITGMSIRLGEKNNLGIIKAQQYLDELFEEVQSGLFHTKEES